MMMRYLNRIVFFILISFALSGSAYAMDKSNQSSGVFKFQQKLATNGNSRAQYKLGTMYESGTGIELDIEKAKHWYGLAAAAGVKAAADRMIYLTIKEQGFDQAKDSAWLKEVKEQAGRSNGNSMFLLAQLYREGLGVNKDLNKALEILDQVSLLGAADVDDEIAMIQAEIETGNKAKQIAKRRNKEEAARLAQQEKQQKVDQQANKEQQIAQQQATAEAEQAAKIRRYEKAMMQLQQEQLEIDKQQAWATGGATATATADDEF